MVVVNGHLIFDNKPFIIQEWKEDMEVVKMDVKQIPIWIKLYKLDIKFWGVNSLSKICSDIGNYIKCENATIVGYCGVRLRWM